MERINIRVAKITHRRLNLIKGQMGAVDLSENTPTLDDVINAGLDLLEREIASSPELRTPEPA